MSDEIRKVIAKGLIEAIGSVHLEARTDIVLNTIHAAGHEIVPGWSEDFSRAPRDGTVIDLWVEGARRPDCYWNSSVYLDKPRWMQAYAEAPGVSFEVDGPPTHWRPRPTPPKEPGE